MGKRCGKCFVACYCSVGCQREDWIAHKKQCKVDRHFKLSEQIEEYLYCLNSSFGYYFDRIFAGNGMSGERYRVVFEQLGDLGFERGRGVTSIRVGINMILRAYNDRKKL